MRLNLDCLRSVMIFAEENTGFDYGASIQGMIDCLDYDEEEILYHIRQCEMNDFFTSVVYHKRSGKYGFIADLTPKGHEFISTIRNPDVWSKTKQIIIEKGGTIALSFIPQLANSIVRTLFNLK